MPTTGYWFLEEAADWRLSPELAAFLTPGPPPLALKRLRARRFAAALTDLLTNTNCRTRAKEMAGTIAREKWAEKAVEVIEGLKRPGGTGW